MSVDSARIEQGVTGEDIFTTDELNRIRNLAGSVIEDVRAGIDHPDLAATYYEATNTATLTSKHTRKFDDKTDATVSEQNGVSTLTIAETKYDESGYTVTASTVIVAGSEGRMRHSKTRNTGLVFNPEQTTPLDRPTYDTALENLVALKLVTARKPEAAIQSPRRLRPGWFRAIANR